MDSFEWNKIFGAVLGTALFVVILYIGVEGLMVKGGELAEPIREATIASTLQRLLLDISAVGAALEWLPVGTGGVTLVIPDIALSGT